MNARVLAMFLAASTALEAQRTEADHLIRDFRLASGETLPELRIHYTTLGRPQRDASGSVTNAVLMLHGTTGSGTGLVAPMSPLFAPGQPLDTTAYYVILPDGIGHGRSSKPSDGLRMRFPKYNYDDMVDAQRRLLVDGLGVRRLRLILGTSMGCMHAWVWGTRHPGFAEALVPLACAPTAIVGRNRMMRKLIVDAVMSDPEWRGGDYDRPPTRGLRAAAGMLFMMTSAPLVQQRQAPTRGQADSLIMAYAERQSRALDANDVIYAFEASRDYDPSPRLETIAVPVLAINSADDMVNPPELGLMERLIRRVRRATYVLIPTSEGTAGHGTHSRPALWREHLVEFMKGVRNRGNPSEPVSIQSARMAVRHAGAAQRAWPRYTFPDAFVLCDRDSVTLVVGPEPLASSHGSPRRIAVAGSKPDAYLYRSRPDGLPPQCLSLSFPYAGRRVLSWVVTDSIYALREPVFATVYALFHETFHMHQRQHFLPTPAGDPRLVYDATEQARAIPDSVIRSGAFQRLAERERRLLADALVAPDDSLRPLLRTYLATRVERMALLPEELRWSEPHEERKEGSGHYFGYVASFEAMGRSRRDIIAALQSDLLDTPPFDRLPHGTRRGSYRHWHIYATGGAIGLLLDRLRVTWRERLQHGVTFVSLLTQVVGDSSARRP